MKPRRDAVPLPPLSSNCFPCLFLSFRESFAMRWPFPEKSSEFPAAFDRRRRKNHPRQCSAGIPAHGGPCAAGRDPRDCGRGLAGSSDEFFGRRLQCVRYVVHHRFLWTAALGSIAGKAGVGWPGCNRRDGAYRHLLDSRHPWRPRACTIIFRECSPTWRRQFLSFSSSECFTSV